MKGYCKVLCVASRGRGSDNVQHFEARCDSCTNTLTSVTKDNLLMTIRFPCILQKQRSEEGKIIRRQYRNDIGVPYQATKGLAPRTDRICGTITTFTTDNNIMTKTNNMETILTYHPDPTKEDLLEYFGKRIAVRKMTPREAFRLMDVEDADIDKILNATETVTLKSGKVMTKKAISKTAQYKLAGNSIIVSCLYHIFRTLLIPGQPENKHRQAIQHTLF